MYILPVGLQITHKNVQRLTSSERYCFFSYFPRIEAKNHNEDTYPHEYKNRTEYKIELKGHRLATWKEFSI